MTKLQPICFIIGFTIFLSGCSQENTSENVIPPKKTIVKKEIKKVNTSSKKKFSSYKYCNKHTKIMSHASNYIKEEFDKGYFLEKDFIGAKAQLFLIESKSPSIFAKNINAALDSYNLQYKLAKKNNCNLNSFKTSPLTKVENIVETFEKSEEKTKGKE